ncbi:MAG: hypothetical protein AB2L24_20580 [Mangrovibacterium sp.]
MKKKIPIISAGDSNLTHLCYPASFKEVFGIIGGKVQNITSYGHLRNYKTSFDFIAKGNAHRVASIDGGFVMADGASYATAYFTGIVASALKSNHFENIESLRQHLSINADESIKPEKTKKKSDIQLNIQSGNQTAIIKKIY